MSLHQLPELPVLVIDINTRGTCFSYRYRDEFTTLHQLPELPVLVIEVNVCVTFANVIEANVFFTTVTVPLWSSPWYYEQPVSETNVSFTLMKP